MAEDVVKIAVVGAGFAGAVVAREFADAGHVVFVLEDRDHVGGNCHTSRDQATGIMVHNYGPHIFHTDRQDVWDYVNRWGAFAPYTNRVKAVAGHSVYPLPINLATINQVLGLDMSPAEARRWIANVADAAIGEPKSFEDQALKFLGRTLYEKFFYGYTKKQWGVEPRDLPASILKRLPVRFNYDDNYYSSRFQGIPVDGYTAIVEKLLDHSLIHVRLGYRFYRAHRLNYDHTFYSGPIDAFFRHDAGRLGYRSLRFERIDAEGDLQGNAVINYCDESVPWTRIAEHKHFTPWERHDKTVAFREYSFAAGPDDTPYYPLRLAADKALLATYVRRARAMTGVTFIGRLGTYRYLDMHAVIGESLDLARRCIASDPAAWSTFSADP